MQNLRLILLHIGEFETWEAVADFCSEGCFIMQTNGACVRVPASAKGLPIILITRRCSLHAGLNCLSHTCTPFSSYSGSPRMLIQWSEER